MPTPTLALALRSLLDADPSRPVLTYLDEATGERTELSARTLDNWIAKTANLLVDGLGIEPGGSVALRLPLHWQTWVWLLACWSAGAVVALAGDESGAPTVGPAATGSADVVVPADVVVTGTGDPLPDGGAAEHVVLALLPLAVPGAPPPAGTVDYDREVRGHGDSFVALDPPGAQDLALTAAGRTWTAGALFAAAERRALAWELRAGDRVLTSAAPTSPGAVIGGLAVLLSGGAMVLAGNLFGPPSVSMLEQELVTAFMPDLFGFYRNEMTVRLLLE